MASTFSKGKGIELITTGEQSGTWGDTTNENWRKFDQALTQGATVPVSDTYGWSRSDTIDSVALTLTWTLDESDAALVAATSTADGTEGRAPVVAFTPGSGSVAAAPDGNFNIRIKGETDVHPPRIFYAYNYTGHTCFLYIGTQTTAANCYELKPYDSTLVVTYPDATLSDSYVGPAVSNLVSDGFRIDRRDKGVGSGADPEFILNANSDDAWYGSSTVAIGKDAGNPAYGTTNQDNDVFIGHGAGANAAGIVKSVLIGAGAGNDLTTQDKSVIIGYDAAATATTTSTQEENVIIGHQAGMDSDGAGNAVFIGSNAGAGVGLDENVAIGMHAMRGIGSSTGVASYSVAVGARAMEFAGSGSTPALGAANTVAIGYKALEGDGTNALTGDKNIAIGTEAGANVQTGESNIMMGYGVGDVVTTGDGNILLGNCGGPSTGNNNVVIGKDAGSNISSGALKNIFIGTGPSETGDSQLIIDYEYKAAAATDNFIYGDMANDRLNFNSGNSSGSHVKIQNTNAAGTGFKFLECIADSDGTPATKFQVRGDGQVQVNGVEVHAADYADMFEWSDGNPEAEDRIGLTVVIDASSSSAGCVRPAISSDNPEDVVGAVSGTACMVGNSAWSHWDKKYVKDDFGRVVLDTVDGKGAPVLNPKFDESKEYINRVERPEWAVVGLPGRVHV